MGFFLKKKTKIVKIIPLFKNGDPENITNYRPISLLPWFSKVLERIMYNRLCKYICEEKLLYLQQFGFQKSDSTDHAIVYLADQIYESFENDSYILGVFIDLSETFDTINHSILLKKLKMYDVNTTNIAWFASYLNGRKQYIKFTESPDTLKKDIKCGVPQGSILGPLSFLFYVNDIHSSSNVLVPIMFADDPNLFFEHSNINTLFKTVNDELIKINEWLSTNKLSLNVGKTKFSLFHKSGKKYSISSHLPTLKVNNHHIESVNKITFLGVLVGNNLSWKEQIKYLENKIAKNIGLVYRAKSFLDKESLLALYYSYIHSYLNYAILAWDSTYLTNLKKLRSQQKHTIRIVHNKTKFEHTKELFKSANVLNLYKLNILSIAVFMNRAHAKRSTDLQKIFQLICILQDRQL